METIWRATALVAPLPLRVVVGLPLLLHDVIAVPRWWRKKAACVGHDDVHGFHLSIIEKLSNLIRSPLQPPIDQLLTWEILPLSW